MGVYRREVPTRAQAPPAWRLEAAILVSRVRCGVALPPHPGASLPSGE
jgi:hypothetical protein